MGQGRGPIRKGSFKSDFPAITDIPGPVPRIESGVFKRGLSKLQPQFFALFENALRRNICLIRLLHSYIKFTQ